MAKKRKIGSAGRFGARYGKRLKDLISGVEKIQKKKHQCPKCKMNYVKRETVGIWKCSKCGTKFAGAAYKPKSKARSSNTAKNL